MIKYSLFEVEGHFENGSGLSELIRKEASSYRGCQDHVLFRFKHRIDEKFHYSSPFLKQYFRVNDVIISDIDIYKNDNMQKGFIYDFYFDSEYQYIKFLIALNSIE